MSVDYAKTAAAYWKFFESHLEMALATCADGDVTARTVGVLYANGKGCFATFEGSVKCAQIRKNQNVALCVGAIQLKGTARLAGSVNEAGNQAALNKLREAYPKEIAMFSQMPGMIMVEITPEVGMFGSFEAGMFSLDFKAESAQKIVSFT